MVSGLLATFLAYASNSAGVGNGADLILCVVSPGLEDRTGQDRNETESRKRQNQRDREKGERSKQLNPGRSV